jgi:phage FluMu protein Com
MEKMNDIKPKTADEWMALIPIALAGKIMRDIFKEKYLTCSCPVCRKMTRIHKKTEEAIRLADSVIHPEKEKASVK